MQSRDVSCEDAAGETIKDSICARLAIDRCPARKRACLGGSCALRTEIVVLSFMALDYWDCGSAEFTQDDSICAELIERTLIAGGFIGGLNITLQGSPHIMEEVKSPYGDIVPTLHSMCQLACLFGRFKC